MNRKLLIAAVITIILGGIHLLSMNGGATVATSVTNTTAQDAAALQFQPQTGEFIATGVLACTPLKSGAAVPAGECVMGLKGDDGGFYSLDTTNLQNGKLGDMNARMKVIGKFTPTDKNSSEIGNYAYDGVIAVRVIEPNQ